MELSSPEEIDDPAAVAREQLLREVRNVVDLTTEWVNARLYTNSSACLYWHTYNATASSCILLGKSIQYPCFSCTFDCHSFDACISRCSELHFCFEDPGSSLICCKFISWKSASCHLCVSGRDFYKCYWDFEDQDYGGVIPSGQHLDKFTMQFQQQYSKVWLQFNKVCPWGELT